MFEPSDEPTRSGGLLPSVILAGPAGQPEAVREWRFQRLLRSWWWEERPDWTVMDWWDTALRDDVRGLLWLPPGPALVAALAQASGPAASRTPDGSGVVDLTDPTLSVSAAPSSPSPPASAAAAPSSSPLGPVPTAGSAWMPCSHPHAEERSPGWPAVGHDPGWPCACQVVLAAAWEACAAWVAAGAAGALVGAAGPVLVHFNPGRPSPQLHDPAREELGAALRVSPNSMGNRIAAARDLVAHPSLHALLGSGGISAWGARIVVLELADLPEDLTAALIAEVVDRIRTRLASGSRPWTTAEIGRTTRAVRVRRAPGHEQASRQRAWADRKVQVFPDRHGMATLHAVLDATDAHRIHRRLSAIAEGLADPDRTRDQARADTLADILLAQADGVRNSHSEPSHAADADADATDPDATGAKDAGAIGAGSLAAADAARPGAGLQPGRVEINVIVPLATLLGLAEDPAHVPGLGMISAEVARALAADGRWRAWISDATNATVIATGTRGYVPSEALARLVRAREPHCRMPGCRAAAQRCDLDHTIPWPRGQTTPANLGPLCRRHHVLKTHARWNLESDVDRAPDNLAPPAWTWRTPAGFTHHDHADPPLG